MVHKVRTPLFPKYSQAAALMRATTGVNFPLVRAMISAIHEQTGTPQNPVDWSDPDTWITERLEGEYAELARKIWEQDDGVLNPRHSYGSYMYINNYELMETDSNGLWKPSEKGVNFLNNDVNVLRELDDQEGVLKVLELLGALEQAMRGDILEEWSEYLHQVSKFSSVASCKATLHDRLRNLIDRGLVDRSGNRYKINAQGRTWLKEALPEETDNPRIQLLNAVKRYNEKQKLLLREQLEKMDPYKFEQLVGSLLEAMGYEDVEVTKQSGDKGVDVVGKVQVGITTVTEVVQVKRTGSITRPVIDQLRGALPYHNAIRGTIITTGKFAGNCESAALHPGAAPITLIDGSKLLELLIEHGVGVRNSKNIELIDVDMSTFEVADDNVI